MIHRPRISLVSFFFVILFAFSVFAEDKATSQSGKSRFEQLELFNKILYLIEKQYYREVDSKKLIEGAIKGMMETLDPHSAFLDSEFFEKMKNDTDGEFGGLGIEVTQKDGVLIIITPIEDSPAFKAGLQRGDKITEINHESILGWTLDEAIKKMKGKIGEYLTLGILREGEREIKHYKIKRETIKVNPVKSDLLEGEFAHIRLTQFQRRAALNVEKAIKKWKREVKKKKRKLRGIILDLRSNPGGLLDEAVDLASIFLKNGVVVSTESRDPSNKDIRYVKKTGYKDLDTPLIVLVNGSSASASEIVTGALQDHQRAIVMGSQTFGKGSVQTVAKVDEENGVKLTIAQYMTPNNRKIQAVGIKPDIPLDEVDGKWIKDHKTDDYVIREKDLRNHLTATIETEEEKAQRLEDEQEAREKRAAKIKKLQDHDKNKDKKNLIKVYNPKEDFQVLQAINFMKSFEFFKKYQKAKNE